VFTVVLLILIEVISRSYTFSFRRPLGITLLAITSVTVVISFGISKTGIHETIRNYARSHHFDMMSRAYDRPRDFMREDGLTVIRGLVVDASTTSATVRLFDGRMLIIYGTSTGKGFVAPEVGSDVVVFGKFNGETFEVKNIKIREASSFEKQETPPPFRKQGGNPTEGSMQKGERKSIEVK
jgi:hypothetical protein